MTGSAALGTEGYRPQADRFSCALAQERNRGGGLEEGVVTDRELFCGRRIWKKVVLFSCWISVFRKSFLISFGKYFLATLHTFWTSFWTLFGIQTPLK